MLKLALKVVLAGAAVWAIWSFVPVAGRPLAERWAAAKESPGRFLDETWTALRGAPAPRPAPAERSRTPERSPARAAAPPARQRPAERPVERHTEADRRALDALLAEQLSATPR